MPPLAELMERVEAAGITLAYSPGRGKVSAKPSAKVTPELAAALKEHKSEIVAALTVLPAAETPPGKNRQNPTRLPPKVNGVYVHGPLCSCEWCEVLGAEA